MDFRRFLSELKERNVVRVGAVYTVTAWALFQIAKTVFETLALPILRGRTFTPAEAAAAAEPDGDSDKAVNRSEERVLARRAGRR